MGSYLSRPVKDKESQDGDSTVVEYGASAMQGWRVSQEDAHVTLPEFDVNAMLFAVFDGHGGAEVAKYAALHLGNHIKSLEKYKRGDIDGALMEGFLSFDALLRQPQVIDVLKAISKNDDSEDGADDAGVDGGDVEEEDDEEDLAGLLESAEEPMEEMIERCGLEQIKSIVQKRIDMGKLLHAAVAKFGSGDSDDSENDEEDDDDDDDGEAEEGQEDEDELEEEEEEEKDGASSSGDTSSDSVTDDVVQQGTGKTPVPSDVAKEPLSRVVLKHLEQENPEESVSMSAVGYGSSTTFDEGATKKEAQGVALKDKMDATVTIVETHSVLINDDHAFEVRPGGGGADDGPEGGTASQQSSTTAVSSSDYGSSSSAPRMESAAGAGSSNDENVPGPSGSGSGCATNGGHESEAEMEADADDDYEPNDEADSDEDEDDEDEWEADEVAAQRANGLPSRRMMLAPGMFEYGELAGAHAAVPGSDSGATACLALIKDRVLYVANVGDSRCVVSEKGLAVEMSYDHKPEDPVETARINKAGGKVTSDGRVNNGLNLSRALGDHNYKRNEALDLSEQMISAKPDIKKLQLDQRHEFMVIACDGIWNSMNSQEVVDFISQRIAKDPSGSLSRICEELFDAVLAPTAGGDGTGMDNTTCVIVRFKHPLPAVESTPPTTSDQQPQPHILDSLGNHSVHGSQKRSLKEAGLDVQPEQAAEEKEEDGLVAPSSKKLKTAEDGVPALSVVAKLNGHTV